MICELGRGDVASYSEIATRFGSRSVAAQLGTYSRPIPVGCPRVIYSDGRLFAPDKRSRSAFSARKATQ